MGYRLRSDDFKTKQLERHLVLAQMIIDFFFNYHIGCWLLIIQLDDLLAHKFQIFVCHTFS